MPVAREFSNGERFDDLRIHDPTVAIAEISYERSDYGTL
jgi:hypothetical protein